MATQLAASTPVKSTSPINAATAYPITKPAKMLIRPRNPRKNAEINPIARSVIKPTLCPCIKSFFAAPAKFNPITITMVPVTTGGRSESIQAVPAALAIKPTTASNTPAATIPPKAAGMPPEVLAAATGARKANEEPK